MRPSLKGRPAMGAGLEPASEEKDHATTEAHPQRLEHRTCSVPCVLSNASDPRQRHGGLQRRAGHRCRNHPPLQQLFASDRCYRSVSSPLSGASGSVPSSFRKMKKGRGDSPSASLRPQNDPTAIRCYLRLRRPAISAAAIVNAPRTVGSGTGVTSA